MSRIAIIGAGNVGATFAYALLQSGLSSEIVYSEPGGHYLARILPRPAIPRATVSP